MKVSLQSKHINYKRFLTNNFSLLTILQTLFNSNKNTISSHRSVLYKIFYNENPTLLWYVYITNLDKLRMRYK